MAQIYRSGPKSLKKTLRNHYHNQMGHDLCALLLVGAAQNKALICGAVVCGELAAGYNYSSFV